MSGLWYRMLALTAAERWAATRRIDPPSAPQQWILLIGIAVMVVLLVLLVAISLRRHQQSQGRRAERFDHEAQRRGLDARERQMLLAIAARSGLWRRWEIFRSLAAFNRGAAQLLAECAQTHTPQENAGLQEEVSRLRQTLGLVGGSLGRGTAAPRPPGSRDIPVGKAVELVGRREHQTVTLRTEVVRNEENEWVVALHTPLDSPTGEPWLVHYGAGLSTWEFRTATVSCAGNLLTLRHSEQIRIVNRRRFPRVPVRWPAQIAHFPFAQSGEATGGSEAGADQPPVSRAGSYAPVFVAATVVELAGPGLRIETRLPAQVDDRVLVVFHVAHEGASQPRALAALGRVKHGRDLERGVAIPDAIDRIWEGGPGRDWQTLAEGPLSIAVELTGLSEEELEELVALTGELSAPARQSRGSRPVGAASSPVYTGTATE